MDLDENDMLATNTFIKTPDLTTNIPDDGNIQFREFYEQQFKNQQDYALLNKTNNQLQNVKLDENTDVNNLISTNSINMTENGIKNINRTTNDIKTFVSVDSRDRDKVKYPKPSNFKIYLGKDFYNVRKIQLASVEFPNTNAVINSNNNMIYWRNQQDIDNDFTITTNNITTYPIYFCNLKIGSYIANTLQTEIKTETNLIRREQGASNGNSILGTYHYFVISLNISTDIVSFISLTLTQLGNNPFAVTSGSGVITVLANKHGLITNNRIYIVGANTTSGIDSGIINGFQLITVVNSNSFTFQVNVNAAQTVSGGGNLVNIGLQAPFQLLWGEQQATIAQNIGFPLENSSQQVQTNITSLSNIYEMSINTNNVNNLSRTYTYIGLPITVGYFIGNTYVAYQTFVIQDVPDVNNILVQVQDQTIYATLINNVQATYVKFGNMEPIEVNTYFNNYKQTFLITTDTYHGYKLSDINKPLTIYNTQDPTVQNDSNYDGSYTILQVPSTTSIVVPGVLYNNNVHSSGIYGNIPVVNPISTFIVYILDIVPNYILVNNLWHTKVTCKTRHNLLIGDKVFFNNIKTTPMLNSSQVITSIIDNYTFLIQYNMTSVVNTNILNGTAFIGTGKISIYFPMHGFNNILNISNGINSSLIIQTINPHNIPSTAGTTTVNTIRLMETNTSPSIDGGSYNVTYISNDIFSITRSPIPFPSIIATDINAGTTTVITSPTGTTTTITTTLGSTTTSSSMPISANTTVVTFTNKITTISIPTILTGIIGMSNDFYLYGISSKTTEIGGIPTVSMNGVKFKVRDVIDINNFTFVIPDIFSLNSVTGGENNVFISSYLHGYTGIQTNTKNDLLNRSINLEGENYSFLTCPQLDTMKNTGYVSNIFARISLDQPPGYVCYKFLSEPKQYNQTPLSSLSELEFSMINHDNTKYEFNDLDFSFVLEITEVIDTSNLFNHSSRRGIIDRSSAT
jgi:hypothetical protein